MPFNLSDQLHNAFTFSGRVVLSCDDNPKFLDFWPLVRRAWTVVFKVEPILALVGSDPFQSSPIGNTYYLKTAEGVPIQNQGKVARYWLASHFNDQKTTLINDIDLMPLTKQLVSYLLFGRPSGALATLGSELYTGPEAGKFMAGHVTTEASSWRKLVNPSNLAWEEWVRSFVGIKKFDHKEDISRTVPSEDPDCFSDESLLRYLLSVNPIPTHHKCMPFWPYSERALDRADWQFDAGRLARGDYVEAHLPRPRQEHADKIEPLITYLDEYQYQS